MRPWNERGTDAARAKTGAPARAHRLRPLLAPGLLVLAGCATVGPDFQRPQVSLGDAWHTQGQVATQAPVDVQWWKEFHDDVLDRLVELASQQNLSLQAAGLRIIEGRAQLGIATGNEWPQVQASAGATAVGLSHNSPNTSAFDHRYLDYQVGFDAVWELDFWGKYRRGTESAAANLLATVADYQSALVSLTAEVARTYVAIRTFEVMIAQHEENVRLQEEGLQIAQSRFKNGATSELDVVQARTLLESTRAQIPQLRTSLQQARNALATLLGQQPGTVEGMLTGAQQIPKAPAQVGMSVPAEMLRRRPDIRSAELFAAAQCARIGVAKADLYPSFTLFGTIGLRASTAEGAGRNLFTSNALAFLAGPRISVPIFNHGRIENDVRVQDARFQQLLVGYRDTVLRAAREVEDATVGFMNAQDAEAIQQRAVEAARRAVQIALVQYREGSADYQRVLDAQRSLLSEENSSTQTTSSVATNVIALYKALGGGWEWRQGQPYVPEATVQEMRARTNWGDMLTTPPKPETKANPAPGAPPPPPPKSDANPPPAAQANPATIVRATPP
jgi:NodT family efflux transporter outer membrane factor (OMF) lipoprotein